MVDDFCHLVPLSVPIWLSFGVLACHDLKIYAVDCAVLVLSIYLVVESCHLKLFSPEGCLSFRARRLVALSLTL